MYNNYGIEETRLSDEEVIDYAYSTANVDYNDDIEAILSIISLEYMDDEEY